MYDCSDYRKSIERLQSPDPADRKTGAEDLYNFFIIYQSGSAAREVFPVLMEAMGDSDPDVQSHALKTFGQIGDISAVPTIGKFIDFPDDKVRMAAIMALGEIKHACSVPFLMKALRNSYASNAGDWRYFIAKSLVNVGKPAVPALIEALDDPNAAVTWKAIPALGEIGDRSAVIPLIKKLGCNGVADALGRIGVDEEQFKIILRILGDKRRKMLLRYGAADALGYIRNNSAIPALIAAFREKPDLRACAAEALAKIKDAIPSLIVILNDADEEVRDRALKALGNSIYGFPLVSQLEEFEKKLDEGFNDLKVNNRNEGKSCGIGFDIAKMKIEIAKRKNQLAPDNGVLLTDKPKPPKRGTLFRSLRRVANG